MRRNNNMILDIYKDYNVYHLHNFAKGYPDRYTKLCQIVGEFALGVRLLYLSVELPHENDKGCVCALDIDRSRLKLHLVDNRLF